MSKSLGNTIDPLELSDKHGADALRFSLVEKASPGQDVPFDEEWTIAAKKFGNKIWNASKFVHIYTDGKETNDLSTIECEENKWIINKFDAFLMNLTLCLKSIKFQMHTSCFITFFGLTCLIGILNFQKI